MTIPEAILSYVRACYVIEYNSDEKAFNPQPRISIRHAFETKKTVMLVPITVGKNVNVNFVWGKGLEVTTLDLYQKQWNSLPGDIMKIFRDKQSMSFYDFLIDMGEDIIIPLSMIKEEFPSLFPEEEVE